MNESFEDFLRSSCDVREGKNKTRLIIIPKVKNKAPCKKSQILRCRFKKFFQNPKMELKTDFASPLLGNVQMGRDDHSLRFHEGNGKIQ